MYFHGELLLELTQVPFTAPEQVLPVSALVDLMTVGRTRMPVASRALDGSMHEEIYEAEFARDALVMAAMVADMAPEITEITVRRLAEVQGRVDRGEGGRFSDREEPGRIPHEIRDANDPIAREYTHTFGWQWPYFGSVDATPMFISAAARAIRNSATFADATIVHAIEAAIDWLVQRLSSNEHSLLFSTKASNDCWQVWADSPDAYHHADGRLARGAVAAIEVQGFVYDALLDAATLIDGGVIIGDASQLRIRAERVRRSVVQLARIEQGERVWFANGLELLDDVVTPLTPVTANMGLLLNTRLLDGATYADDVDAIVREMFDANTLMSPSGIRTLAANEVRFRPYGYHTGTVWPWQNLVIANGLRHHGFRLLAMQIEHTMQRVCDEAGCAPEFVQGGDTDNVVMNDAMMLVESPDGNGGSFTHYAMNPAQKQQGWTVFGLYAVDHRTGFIADVA